MINPTLEDGMDALEALFTRRSIRKFREGAISEETVETLLRAAMAAPSAMNEQPWHFVVIRSREVLDQIHANHPYASMLLTAPLAIAVCGDTTREHHPGYWVVDCSIATSHLLIAAHALKLGAVWVGVYPRPERMELLTSALNLPPHIQPLALVALGLPGEVKAPADRYTTSRIHQDTWNA